MFDFHPHNLWVFSLTALLPRLQPHSEALECISGNGVPACMRRGRGWNRLGESEACHLTVSLPLLFRPSRSPLLSWAHQCRVCGVWVVVDHVQGGTGAGWDAEGLSERRGAKGHWRLSSVSDRENAITTSSAPWSMLCCGNWLIWLWTTPA